jgi:hypothetical protein
MEKRHVQLLTLVILSVFLFSSITVVDAKPLFIEQLEDSISGVPGFFRDVVVKSLEALGFEDLGDGRLETSRFLLMLITVMLVYSVLGILGIFDQASGKPWIKWVVSVSAGILAFLFISGEAIRAITLEYEIMAIALNIILPAAIVLVFTWQIQAKVWKDENKINPAFALWFSRIIVLSMGLYLFFKLLSGEWGVTVTSIGWIVLVGLGVYFFVQQGLIKHFVKTSEKSESELAEDKTLAERITYLENMRDGIINSTKLSDSQKASRVKRYDDQIKALRKLK